MRLSIIIPVYNIQQYLADCVQSVQRQTFTDYEIILVNDGSTDNSGALCDELATQDKRIHVVHKVNGGLSDARNAGLIEAKGEYIHFLDGDDYYATSDDLQTLIDALTQYNEPDALLFCRQDVYEDLERICKERPYDTNFINQESSVTAIFAHLLQTQRFNMSACFQLLKRSVLVDNEIWFEKGLRNEDIDWSLSLWHNLQRVCAVNTYAYCYRHRENSITTTYSLLDIQSYDHMFTKWTGILSKANDPLSKLQLAYLAFVYPTLLYGYYFLPSADRASAYIAMKRMKQILRYSNTKKARRTLWMMRILGFYLTLHICACYKMIRLKGIIGLIQHTNKA